MGIPVRHAYDSTLPVEVQGTVVGNSTQRSDTDLMGEFLSDLRPYDPGFVGAEQECRLQRLGADQVAGMRLDTQYRASAWSLEVAFLQSELCLGKAPARRAHLGRHSFHGEARIEVLQFLELLPFCLFHDLHFVHQFGGRGYFRGVEISGLL